MVKDTTSSCGTRIYFRPHRLLWTHAQGRTHRRRLRTVTLGTGSLAVAIGLYGYFRYGKGVRSGFVALVILGASTLFLTVLPNERKLAKGMTSAAVLLR